MEVPSEMLLHPELLTNEQMKLIIHQRKLKVPQLDYLSRDELLEVFHLYCVPHGQRRYRDSGRGKILNKARQISPEQTPSLNLTHSATQKSRKISHSSDTERLKPPPDLITSHMKRIKIESKPVVNIANDNKRKMSVSDCESPPVKKDRKPITWP